jgi:endonuclease/exonuclease/phosphatase family metal-dependent hydrolase
MKQGTIAAPRVVKVAGAMLSTIAAQPTWIGEEDSLNVMTYNIRHGKGNTGCEDPLATPDVPPSHAECAVDLGAITAVVRAADPDVVSFQEVDRFWGRSCNVDQVAELASLLGMTSCYAANLDHPADEHGAGPHQYGVLILSKFPITSCENTLFPTPENWEQRGMLDARISVDGIGEVAILNTHFQAGRDGAGDEARRQRIESARIAAEYVSSLDVPWVLMGDLNAESGGPDLAPLLTLDGAVDAWAVAGEGSGFSIPASPDEEATSRIDFVIVSSAFAVVSAETIVDDATRMASDHFPVTADLAFVGET